MKFLFAIAVVLMGVIAYRIPSPLEIGEGIIQAQKNEVARLRKEAYEAEKRQMEREEQAVKQSNDRRAGVERNRRQAEFDALPKWDTIGRPINRQPPPGLTETRDIPPSTFKPIFTPPPSPTDLKNEIERKYGK